MSHSRSAVAITILLLLILCCRTGSLLVISPDELVRIASDSAKFECHFDSCARLLWNGPGIGLGVPQHYTITTGEYSTTLTINNLTESDEGPYFCTCNGRNSTQADLIVHHNPNVDNVILHQTFQRGDAAAIECNAYLGDPVYPLVWVHNGMAISPDSDNQKTLTIVNINDEHAGIYKCGFNVLGKPIIASITVTVQERNETNICRPLPVISFSYASQQPLNLTCDCRTDKSDSSLVFQWNIPNLPIVPNSSLVIPYDQVSNGRYICQALRAGVTVEQHVMEVTVIDIPPLTQSPYTENVTRREGHTAHLHYEFLLPPSPKLNFQWKKMYAGSNTDVDFGSRFNYTVNGKILRFNITNLVAADTGMYVMNVSNQYGHSELHTNITVEELDRTIVILELKNISCDSIEMHEEDIVAQVVEKVKACPLCEVELDQEIDTSCTPSDDQDTVTFKFTLVSTSPLRLQQSNAISLMIDGNVTARICPNACLPVSTSPPPPPSGDTSVVVAVVVSVLITVLVVLLVLISTFTLKKFSRGICDKHQVGHIHEEDDQPEVVIQAPAAECTGYVRVNRTDPSHTNADPADPTATPVSVPFPPHIAPAPSATAKAKRPDRLYIRSHSYHGSTRTPQA